MVGPYVIGVDIGGTKTAAGLVDSRGALSGELMVAATPSREGGEAVLAEVRQLVEQLMQDAPGPVRGIGVGSAGVIGSNGVVASATDLIRNWTGTDIPGGLAAQGIPVTAINDVHAFGLGEAWVGAARGLDSVLTIAVGTGVGGALILEGHLIAGRTGTAGSVGHVDSLYAERVVCSCGQIGHVEGVASGPALEARYAELTGTRLGLREIGSLAAGGDQVSIEVIHRGASAMGEAIASLVNVIDPEAVVVGGGVVGLGAPYLDIVRGAMQSRTLPRTADVQLVAGSLGGSANVIGAARRTWDILV